MVNLLQLVKQTFTLLILNKWRRRQTMGFLGRGFESHHPPITLYLVQIYDVSHVGSIPPSTNLIFYDVSQVEVEKHALRYTQGLKPLGY